VSEAGAKRIAVVLLNLGGPDSPEAVEPFLFNLFNDPAIIGLPNPFRGLLAKLISGRRAPVAREIYARIGGGSPLLPNTEAQAAALSERLTAFAEEVRVFIAMRYWHPMSEAAVQAVKDWDADHVLLLPLYPQYSTTTTASAFKAWDTAAKRAGLDRPTQRICCYPRLGGFAAALTRRIGEAYRKVESAGQGPPRLLFSAHGVPASVIRKGDPYQWQVERTAQTVVHRLAIEDLDWVVCYQSRVGPLPWTKPYLADEVKRAGADGRPLVVAPIAFVSEHSETLVELDIEYRELAQQRGVPLYERVPTVDAAPAFMDGLAELVRMVVASRMRIHSEIADRICPRACGRCGFGQADTAR
jgi:ferrochelatase